MLSHNSYILQTVVSLVGTTVFSLANLECKLRDRESIMSIDPSANVDSIGRLTLADGFDHDLESRLNALHQPDGHAEPLDASNEPEFDAEALLQLTLSNPDLKQHVSRCESDGADTMICYRRVTLAPGERRHAMHIALHPPMPAIPDVEAFMVDPISARIRITDRQRFGARLEIVLEEPVAVETQLMVEVMLTAPLEKTKSLPQAQ